MRAGTRRRVVVTGLGTLNPLGNTTDDFWAALIAGKSGIRKHPDPEVVPPVGWVDFDFAARFTKAQRNTMDRVTLMALVAAQQALEHAGLAGQKLGRQWGLFLGIGAGGQESTEAAYAHYYGHPAPRRKVLSVVAAMSQASSAHVAIRHGITGECQTYATGCSSSAVSTGEAFRRVRDGYLDGVVAGGAECVLLPGALSCWQPMRVMCADPPDEPGTGCRPFSMDRTGFAIGEGAGFLVMEALESAIARGAQPLAEVLSYGVSNDASHITNPDAQGQAAAMGMALEEAGIEAGAIDYVNAHGTATRVGDIAETNAIKMALGPRALEIPVSATKSAHGHMFGATGAVELIATAMALRTGTVPPTTHWRERDPECDLDYVPGVGRRMDRLDHALFNSFAFGGNNVAMVLRRWE